MRLTGIRINNILGARAIERRFTSPVVLFAGRNFSGKSSIQTAVRMALTEEPERVALKKDYAKLVTEGAKEGEVTVTVATAQEQVAIHLPLPDGKATPWTARPPFLAYCLHPERFALLSPDERQQLLFDLMGVKADGQAAMKRMLDRGCEAKYVEAIGPALKHGFPEAHRLATDCARDAKGAWRGVTGETWGKDKAGAWQPRTVAFTNTEREILAHVQRDLAAASEAERDAGNAVAALKAAATVEVSGDPKKAARAKGLAEDYQKAIGERDTYAAEVRRIEEELAKPETLACPHCGGMVVQQGFRLAPYTGGNSDRLALKAQLPRAQESLRLTRSRCAGLERELSEAREHATRLEAAKEVKDRGPSPHEIAKAEEAYRAAQEKVRIAREEERRLIDMERDAANAAGLKTKADAHHAEVLGWLAVADAVSPSGIPAELLSTALKPFNDRLRESAVMTGWRQVAVGADMAITAEGRGYALLSESERWRADAMLAYAIAAAGPRFLMLDRLDVLDMNARGEALAWLTALVDQHRLDGALVCATLKAAPQVPGVESFWLEQGQVLDLARAA